MGIIGAFKRTHVDFRSEGTTIRGTLYLPGKLPPAPLPCVVFGHGWGMVAGGDLEDFAALTVARGMAALTFDYRHLGKSDGVPRQHINPWQQVEDFRSAVSFVRHRAEVDADRIGVWGSSYGGGHVLVVAATDPRVKCAVAQVPTISGWQAAKRRMSAESFAAFQAALIADRENYSLGLAPALIQTVSDDPAVPAAYTDAASHAYMMGQAARCPDWLNFTTLSSLELARCYEPGAYAYRISETPLLMVVADQDRVTPVDLQRDTFARVPCLIKDLLEVPGDHYSVYGEHFSTTSTAAADWFDRYL